MKNYDLYTEKKTDENLPFDWYDLYVKLLAVGVLAWMIFSVLEDGK